MDEPQEEQAPPSAPSPRVAESKTHGDRPSPAVAHGAIVLPETTDQPQGSTVYPARVPSCSASSSQQVGHQSTPSDLSGDRVFPIRSVVSVDPSSTKGSMAGDDRSSPFFVDPDGRDGSHRPGKPRREPSTAGLPSSITAAGDRAARLRTKRPMSGPFSSIQADAARQGTVPPLSLNVVMSDRESDASGSHDGDLSSSVSATAPPRPESPCTVSGPESLAELPHVTTRFTHIETEDGHAVITGRDGTLQRCEDEPIHTPGAVQGFGVLLALREEDEGCFVVRYVSENSERMLTYSPKQLFELKNFMDILTEEQQDNLLDHIDFIRDEDADPSVNGPEVLSLSIRPRQRTRTIKLWCAIHINSAHPDLVICEFELDDDRQYPLRPEDESTPDTPHDTLHSNPTLEEIEESTEILNKPLRVLRSARKQRGEQGAMRVFDILSQVQEQLCAASTLDSFLKVLVGIVKELTGFHRVMIYQFDSNFNGKVVTELVDTSQTIDLYKGLHFPASDIPAQALNLYKVNKVRLLYDRDLETARIVCRTQGDLEVALDMTHAYLRAMSPIHLKYLANMAVRSSMSISIAAFGELWGLIACHSYGPRGMRVSFPIRKLCRLVGDTASRNIERLSYASRLQARKLINTAPTDKNPSGYIVASSDDLLKLFDADLGLLSIKGETKILGSVEDSQEVLALLEYLRMRKLTSIFASQAVGQDFPDLCYLPGFQIIAGLLYVPLSVGGLDFIVFLRRGQVKEVKWAGNPYEKTIREGTAGYLEPRSSFKSWHETVVGTCREWTGEQVETAAVLCLVYGKFIEVWREKEAAIQRSKLTRLLLANSAHEVRTPLNAIINYLEIALEGTLDTETRKNLIRSHSASKSLIYVINDLLDLAKIEEGQDLVKDEIFDLMACIREATDPFYIDAKRKGIQYEVASHPGLPRFVHGDGRILRQAISNITANAIAHTKVGSVEVEVLVSEIRDRQASIEIIVADSGAGMSAKQLDALFRDLEQVSSEEAEQVDTSPDLSAKADKPRTLGLGLAVVARAVRNMDGQLRLKSEEGQGTRFVVQLPFLLPDESSTSMASFHTSPLSHCVTIASDSATAPAGEMTLIDRSRAINVVHGEEKTDGKEAVAGSQPTIGSLSSQASRRSGADRLINAIQTPLPFNDAQGEENFTSHRDSQDPIRSGSSWCAALKANDGAGFVLPPSVNSRAAIPSASARPHQKQTTLEPGDAKPHVRAIKVPEEYTDIPAASRQNEQSRVLLGIASGNEIGDGPAKTETRNGEMHSSAPMRALVAEDNPINMKILQKRLERTGHEVYHAVNGEVCAALFKDEPSKFDIILMDMQMPIVDGLASVKIIRSIENSTEHKGHSKLAEINGRIPVFAVSASLVETRIRTYVDAGFDGWILKPIDFDRLHTLLKGIYDSQTRDSCLYIPGQWERGGWFLSRNGNEGDDDLQITPKADMTTTRTTSETNPIARDLASAVQDTRDICVDERN
ncbi:putative phytochrome-like histidine kinase [Drechmeria coniospora]|uniref:Putative phytochrome-like histidine kinase n=1 Tax=Drechmeria coniospora TaxID=98403 RepID=A0A151GDJ9_DRECN|nr:putative phytochrome-like histidine kinase [Drechmeria coniospora]KYK55182.1 putative phytochrome-like histidine kinase [Drechmeria coniospora]